MLHVLEYGELIRESAEFVLVDLQYNAQRSFDGENSKHERFLTHDMKAMVQLFGAVLIPKVTWPSVLHVTRVWKAVEGVVEGVSRGKHWAQRRSVEKGDSN